MAQPPKNTGEKFSKVWSHTTGIIAVVAAVVTIIGYFGIHPPAPPKSEKQAAPHVEPPKSPPPEEEDSGKRAPGVAPKPNGIGTLHFEVDLTGPQGMLTDVALSSGPGSAVLVDPKSMRKEGLSDSFVFGPIAERQPVLIWRKGTRILKGVEIQGDAPEVYLQCGTTQMTPIRVDAEGRLSLNIVWPASKSMQGVQFTEPVRIGGLAMLGGLGIQGVQGESVIPSRLTIDLPKPGEVLGAIHGELNRRPTAESRFLVIRAMRSLNEPSASWNWPIDSEKLSFKGEEPGILDQGLYSVQIVYSDRGK